jgi:hypothetical protein
MQQLAQAARKFANRLADDVKRQRTTCFDKTLVGCRNFCGYRSTLAREREPAMVIYSNCGGEDAVITGLDLLS